MDTDLPLRHNQAGKKPEIAREPGQIIFKIVREILKTVREHLSAGPKGRFSLRPEARIFLIFEPLDAFIDHFLMIFSFFSSSTQFSFLS